MKDLEKLTGRQFDRQACSARNRLAARRDSIDAGSVRLLPSSVQPEQFGKLPKTDDAALTIINGLAKSAEPLTAEDVHIHYAEAANTNFVDDRYLFLDKSTLRNVANNAQAGVAFMNSHRTGGLSHSSELPFGRTFCGAYEETGDGAARSMVGIYMLAGTKPNGANGPSTDDLHRMIEAGTLFDVSVGLYGGERVCDVCGHELHAYDDDTREPLCEHVPGTSYRMSEKEQKAQKGRGVKDGFASYSLVDAKMGEVSAVYDGAVPGAGFRKALAFNRSGRLEEQFLSQARGAYATLLRRGELERIDGDPPTGRPFEEQLDAALTLLTDCITRGQEIASKRLSEQRSPVSAARREQLERLHGELGALLAAQRPTVDPDRLLALRRRILEQRIKTLSGVGV